MASLYPTAEEARITCAIVDAAAKVRDLNFQYLAEGKGATVTARFGPDGITFRDANRAGEGSAGVFQRVYARAIGTQCATQQNFLSRKDSIGTTKARRTRRSGRRICCLWRL